MHRAGALLAGVLASAGLLSACASFVESRAESVLLEAMPRVIGPADRYVATVQGVNADASHIDGVLVVGDHVRRLRMPVIDRFNVDLRDVSVDRLNKQLTGIGAAQAGVRIKGADLTAYLQQQSWIAEPSVQLQPPDSVLVSGLLRVPGLSLATSAPAAFRVRLIPDGPRLLVAVDSLAVGSREAPSLLRSLAATAINPLFDLSAYAVPSSIDRVSVEADTIVMEASGSRLKVAPPR